MEVNDEAIIEALAGFPVFIGVPASHVKDVISELGCSNRRFVGRDYVARAGDVLRSYPVLIAGVVTAASLYENADTMLRLKEDSPAYRAAAPVLHLNFDGALDAGIAEKLSSFLYYV